MIVLHDLQGNAFYVRRDAIIMIEPPLEFRSDKANATIRTVDGMRRAVTETVQEVLAKVDR